MAKAPQLDFELEADGDGVLRRSRTGCLTCRKRKKKCPEKYEGGSCLRCLEGGWKCIRPSATFTAPRSRRNSRSPPDSLSMTEIPSVPASVVSTSTHAHSDLRQALPEQNPSHPKFKAAFPTSSSRQSNAAAMLAGFPFSIGMVSSGVGAQGNFPASPPAATVPPPLATVSGLHPAAQGRAFSAAPVASTSAFVHPPFTHEPLSTGLVASTSSYVHPPLPAQNPAAHLAVTEQLAAPTAELDLSAFSITDEDVNRILAQLDALDPLPSGSTPSSGASLASTPSMPRCVVTEKDKILVDFYHVHVVGAWSVSYPPVARATIVAKCLEITSKHAITRQASKAAAAGYIKLLQHRRDVFPFVASAAAIPPDLARLDVDPLALIEETIALLNTPQESVVTLEAHLWALSDLHIALATLDFPSKSYEIAAMGDRLIQHALGSTPRLRASQLEDYSSFAIHAYAMIDLMRSIAKRVPTCLELVYEEPVDGETGENGAHDMWFGMPFSLAALVSKAANLCAAAQSARAAPAPSLLDGQLPPELVAHAAEVTRLLETWRPCASVYDRGKDRHSLSHAAEIVLQQETWRYTGLLLLHRTLSRLPPSHPTVKPLITRLLGNLKATLALSQSQRALCPALLDWWFPVSTTSMFLVGAVVTSPEDRAFARQYFGVAGNEPHFGAMVRALEATWAVSDETGMCADWFDVVTQRGIDWVFW
ncbi:hypothetical protein JCM10207_000051 [Rhodosporidiobolus poonsookiae]